MDTAVHTFEPTPEPAPRPSANAPQLRTLLLTDLVDSTGLIERLGDGPASDLFRAHDRLVLQLQQQWRGRLIDRSDGLLLLFERPIDGLGFALDYMRGLLALGAERDLELRARAGLHVGEVLTWRNSAEAVSVGAKPLEVEGLAKPMAARLMAMARPGQILLSAVAEPLAHRAARELGERGQHLAWKSWGRWRFKGVPEVQEIFEVGEPDLAPLRAPSSTPKAWRDIPVWRRPAALAAEVAVLAVGVLAVWLVTRPEPAIAFAQRDWVVVGDLRNLTGQSALDDSLEQAFRISLEQSRYVNVLSDLKARDTLQRMQRPADTVLDRAVASEIALRDGARAVILPTVAEVGGRVRVSAEVIDPHTQTTVYAESAEGRGVDSALDSIDDVTAALRGKLGEAVKSIEKDSVPLPQVTTTNLDALRAYALGQKAYGETDYANALKLYEQATTQDPQFALAWVGQAKSRYAAFDANSARPALERARALRSRLAPREALYLDGWGAEFESPVDAFEKWRLLTNLYPDFMPAFGNTALRLIRLNRFPEAVDYARHTTDPRHDLAGKGYEWLGRAQLGSEDYKGAADSFDKAVAHGSRDSAEQVAQVAAATRRFEAAQTALKKMPQNTARVWIQRAVVLLDQGNVEKARESALRAVRLGGDEPGSKRMVATLTLAVIENAAGRQDEARTAVRNVADEIPAALKSVSLAESVDVVGLALSTSLLSQQLGERTLANQRLAELQGNPLMASPELSELAAVVRANDMRLSGRPEQAVEQLRGLLNGHELFQTRQALLEACLAAQRTACVNEQAKWLAQRRGQAYAELIGYQVVQALNVASSDAASSRLDRVPK
ncbi:putative peptide modification system cyclase [Lysobacter tyrosinilyticus]